ncbi:dihydroxyacetone kinase subunit DhaL [Conexibacter sp. JD483]|uniref:dihydroxyacetone kinase subunit DhaL n=1 Tax=unclassified Conexibacter TaxID=2627773 RepID=UPI00271BE765|nr:MULTISPECIES: dihydroxyacetone kinase subunit DhaL [unclassified Conexibacter]MDO8189098.1 dihydroxyacetone kinase subunit DhaL [Conexibacter sp. CPCC 205706]MDO8200854.1 dihydroxyacetone kinase subunit DhaL [Conexibacter sp. CPCC 205762]MDR9371713.1 dihydroxyacetone kinase subunit DhaL [Conexibacter sp. JD483]
MDVAAWVRAGAAVLEQERDRLNRLDADIGDGDHGANMTRGFKAAAERVASGAPAADALRTVGMTLLSTVGGAAGPLYGSFFIGLAGGLRDVSDADADVWATALEAATAAVQRRGKAEPGDKTMVDALVPARDALRGAAAGASLQEALQAAADAAQKGAEATVPLLARKGRASYLGERSIGHQDPGATSTALLLQALAATADEQ